VRHLEWRIRLVGVGAILAVFGIAADVELLRWAALIVLAAAAVLSVVASRGRGGEDDPAAETPEDAR